MRRKEEARGEPGRPFGGALIRTSREAREEPEEGEEEDDGGKFTTAQLR